ncbi:membrane fusion protein [Vibrio sp. ES.051]|uniref:HlyD family secretion protein n=1 Tax=Vibrio sp. ES.051 TaxID=1761909 RepID=UPI000BF4B86E|nr:HlyD family efflux transporter periplasmic adaptor subunit [Vibrio sp. ES.051]PFG56468.1 membrane fusion protein [Vibrio sp. ES.051]
MVARGKHIYRPEYFEAQKTTNEGRILLKTSLNQNVYLFCSMLVLFAVVTFLTFGEYTRRETLVGLVSPLGGMIKVQANDSGYIHKLFVKEGQVVESLTPLYEIQTERFDESGIGVKSRLLDSIDNQYQLITERRKQEKEKVNFERQVISEEIKRLEAELTILHNVLNLSKNELSLTQSILDKQRILLKNNFLSDLDYQKQKLDLMAKQSQVEGHNLNLQRLKREKESLIATSKNLSISLNITLKDIDRQLEEITQSKVEFLHNSDSQVLSPIGGIVASILAEEGHSVTNGQPLLIIVPEGKKVFVELYAPSRSVGFLKVGQNVRLRFDAFPYEKFGVQTGTIANISKSSIAPEMIENRRLLKNTEVEGLYRVKVELSKSTITVYGKEETLISGMTVTGDIELDTRKVYEWILEPLYTVKGKI